MKRLKIVVTLVGETLVGETFRKHGENITGGRQGSGGCPVLVQRRWSFFRYGDPVVLGYVRHGDFRVLQIFPDQFQGRRSEFGKRIRPHQVFQRDPVFTDSQTTNSQRRETAKGDKQPKTTNSRRRQTANDDNHWDSQDDQHWYSQRRQRQPLMTGTNIRAPTPTTETTMNELR